MVQINTIKVSPDEDRTDDERRRYLLRQQAMAEELGKTAQEVGGGKVYSHGTGLAKVAGSALAGYWDRQAHEKLLAEQKAADDLIADKVGKAFGGGESASSPTAAIDETGDGGKARDMAYARASAGIESGGNYAALGPVTKSGDRAYGKHQVMGANIPGWSQEALGRSLTPQEFLSDRDAQDAVFKAKFGQYAQKYGPEGAAKAWFAGEKGMNNPNAHDQLGTTVAQYGQRFMRGLGQDPGAGAPANPTSTPSGPTQTQAPSAPSAAAGISAQDIQELVRNPRTRSYGLALYNAHVQEIATQQAQAAELAKEQRTQAFEREKIGLTKEPKLTTLKAGETAIDASGKVVAEGVGGQGGDPKEVAEVRKEILSLPSYKTYAQSLPAYRSMVDAAKRDDKAADLNLVYGVGKVFDPNSVVREGEIVMAQDTGGLSDRLNGMIRSLQGGSRLSPEQRAGLLREAQSRVQEHKSAFDTDAQFYSGIAERRKYNRADVIPQFGDMPNFDPATINTVPRGPAGPAAAPSAPSVAGPNGPVRVRTPEEARQLPPGIDFVLPDGRIGTVPKSMAPAAAPQVQGQPRPMSGSSLPYSAYPIAGQRG